MIAVRTLPAVIFTSTMFLAGDPIAAKTTLDIKTEPAGARVTATVNYPQHKKLGECISPCQMKFRKPGPDWIDYRLVFELDDHITAERLGSSGEKRDGVVYHQVGLHSLAKVEAELEAERIAKRQAQLNQCKERLAAIAKPEMDAAPCKRYYPSMPTRAVARGLEGYCDITFIVTPEGLPTDITTRFCSDSMFENASTKSIRNSIYFPKRVNSNNVESGTILQRVTFRLAE